VVRPLGTLRQRLPLHGSSLAARVVTRTGDTRLQGAIT
jgi:hypothetical protein